MARLLILAFVAVVPALARNLVRQGSYNITTILTTPNSGIALTKSSAPSSQSPASLASAGAATITNSANATRSSSSSSSSTTSAPSTCCYLYPRGVGINTWWSSSVDITVATVITTWLKYNNTMIPGNSTTKTVVNASTIYGDHAVPSIEYTGIPISPTLTTTRDQCSAWDANLSCTAPFTTVYTYSAYSTIWYNTSDIFSGVPNSLLPSEAVLYGRTSIDRTSVATFPSQGLAIRSPTPYYLYSAINVLTSKECMATMTYTSLTTKIRATRAGEVTYISTVVPTTTVTAFEGSSPINAGASGDVYLNHTVAMPFPDGDYRDFNFTTWADGVTIGPAPGPVDAYMFLLPENFPAYFDSIPYVKSDYPEIGKCTNFAGDGEPTVHVQVNQLTDTSHVTQTINGNLDGDAGATTTEDLSPSVTLQSPRTEEKNSGLVEPTSTAEESGAGVSIFTPRVEETHTALTEPTSTPDRLSDGDDVQAGSAPDETQAEITPDLVSIIQQATPGPSGQETQELDEQRVGTTSALVGDIIASVIGLVPQKSDVQEDNTRVDAATHTQAQQQAQSTPAPAVITVGGSAVTANDASEFVIGSPVTIAGDKATPIASDAFVLPNGGTLSAGRTAVILDGITLSLAPSGNVVVNGVTSPVPSDGNVIASLADEQSALVLHGTTLLAGSSAVVSVITYSLPSTGGGIFIDGRSTSLPAASSGSPITLGNGIAATPTAVPELVIGGQTLVVGGSAITVSGTTYSASGTQVVVVDSGRTVTEDTEDLTTASVTSSSGARGTSSRPARSTAASSTESSPAETTSSSDASQIMSSSAFIVAMLVACLL
ncbi:hypothetical protein AC579_778 [Pseudocercospora musae]|uniref:Uncharacterized protein n=1 Tax=Pseudocercospora musae TaxID=113226 RepID=A0A139IHC0_9PEZI|nr:hypothetical protein AC579_778 [Pseudocercospora musae]